MGASVNNNQGKLNNSTLNSSQDVKKGMEPMVIGQLVKQRKRFTSLIMIFVFGVFFACLYYLPEIYSRLQNVDIDLLKPSDTKSSKEEYVNNNEKFFEIYNSKIYIDGVMFSSFTINSNAIQYKITNYNDKKIAITELKYYLNLYDTNQKIISTYEITGNIVNPNSVVDSFTKVSSEYLSRTKFIKITKENQTEITDIELQERDGYGILTCSLNTNKYMYYFKEKKLAKIRYEANITPNDVDNFELEIESFNNKKQIYNNATGYVTNVQLISISSLIKFTADIDLSSQTLYDLGDDLLLKYGTEAKQVNFELETKGYDCQ